MPAPFSLARHAQIFAALLSFALMSGCAADASEEPSDDEGAEDVQKTESAVTAACDDSKSGLCVGTSNLYYGGQFSPGYRYDADKTNVCSPTGKCVLAKNAVTWGTLDAFTDYVKQANLSVVSIQEISDASLQRMAARLGPTWARACFSRVVYRTDRVTLRGEPMRVGADPINVSPTCGVRLAKKSAPTKELLFVGGGILGTPLDVDKPAKPGQAIPENPMRVLARWIDGVRGGIPVVVGLDMNGNASKDPDGGFNPQRWATMKSAGFADSGQRNTVVGPKNRTLDYLWVKGATHTGSRGFRSGGSDHVWIWSKIAY